MLNCLHIYRLACWLVLPFVVIRLAIRCIYNPAYRSGWLQRLGLARYQLADIWMHAVSLGESQVAIQLLSRLSEIYGNTQAPSIFLTVTTPSGMAVLQKFAATEESSSRLKIQLSFMSYDCLGIQQRVLNQVRPRLLVCIETEIWPNLFAACIKRDISCVIANARLSSRSAKRQKMLIGLFKPILRQTHFLVQDKASMCRYRVISNSPNITITGNCKVDRALNSANNIIKTHAANSSKDKFTLVFGSIRNDESKILFNAAVKIIEANPNYLIIWVPRHPEKTKKNLNNWLVKSSIQWSYQIEDKQKVSFVLDLRYGHLNQHYAIADLVVMGGTFGNGGSQNIIEPCALGKTVVCGPSVRNFASVHHKLNQAAASCYLYDRTRFDKDLYQKVQQLSESAKMRETMGMRAQAVIKQMAGATTTQARYIRELTNLS